ncbi:ABC transporter permease [Paludibacterium denitrificans]|uniref:ABC transporter permease n=1 Tax=Paludibacterium denitrificans TaxID=2675226 RepID=UPI001E38C5A7|nr:ABC transporter permease [Paludibacterium denitrificans]
MVREKERGTVEQLIVSPLSPFGIMFPKVVSMTGVILIGVALSLFLVLIPLFAIPVKGSLALFFAVSGLYVFTTAGLGLFAATVARNLAQVGMLAILILAPMLFLSGALDPAGSHAAVAAPDDADLTAALLSGYRLRHLAQRAGLA